MTARILVTTSFAALTTFLAAPAFADVTAEEVWESWKVLTTAYGQTYTVGGEARSGDTLAITDFETVVDSDDVKVVSVIPEVSFRETGDGRVEITVSDSYQVKFEGKGSPEAKTGSGTINITQTGMKVTASGDPDAISYDVVADSIVAKGVDFASGGVPQEIAVDVELSKIVAAYQVTPAELTGITSSFAAQEVTFHVAGKDIETQSNMKATGQMSNIAGATTGTMPKDMAFDDMADMLAQGYSLDGSITYDGGQFALAVLDEEDGATNFESSSAGGSLKFSFDKDKISYGVAAKSVAIKASGSAIAFPELTAGYDAASFDMLMPISKSDEVTDFGLQTRVEGLSVSDEVWAMFDRDAILPRDPATMIVSLKGKVKALVNLFDPAAIEGLKEGSPYELHNVDVEEVQLSAVGVEFKGDGALAFDNSQSPELAGMAPMPTGKLNLSLSGANELMEKLKALGLIGDEETMMFGMFAGMLAKQGATPDSLVSEVEFKDGGKITFNGAALPF